MDTIYDDGHGPHDPGGRPYAAGTGPAQFADTGNSETRRVWLIAGLVALGIILALLIALIAAHSRVQTAQVQRSHIVAWESLTGIAVAPANKYAAVSCHCDAPVSRVFTSVGATVTQGDALVELSHPNAQAAYAAALQELAAAQEAYNGARDNYAVDVRQAQQDLAQAVEAQGSLSPPAPPGQIPTGMNTPVGETTGAAGVTRPGNVALPQASVTADEARARVTAAQQRMQQYLVPFQQRLTAAQQSFQDASRGVSQSFLRAPIRGQVLELHARPGEPTSAVPSTLIATIADLSSVTIHAPLTDAQQESVRVGMPVQVRVAQLPDQAFSGTVQQITNELVPAVAGQPRDLQRVAVITFVNNQGLVKPDMTARVLVQMADVPSAISVPNGAIQHDRDGQPFVRVRQGARWIVTPVRLGPTDGTLIVVLSGLREGQIVQVRPQRSRPVQPAA